MRGSRALRIGALQHAHLFRARNFQFLSDRREPVKHRRRDFNLQFIQVFLDRDAGQKNQINTLFLKSDRRVERQHLLITQMEQGIRCVFSRRFPAHDHFDRTSELLSFRDQPGLQFDSGLRQNAGDNTNFQLIQRHIHTPRSKIVFCRVQ